jgi:hypothetical protein
MLQTSNWFATYVVTVIRPNHVNYGKNLLKRSRYIKGLSVSLA